MNTNKIVAALVAALTAGSAFAATAAKTNYVVGDQIYIAGSTAMAGKSMPAIGVAASNAGYTLITADNAALGSAKIALFRRVDTAVTGTTTTITTNAINVHFIGSEGGTVVTASKQTQPFLPVNYSGAAVCTKDATVNGFVVPSTNCTVASAATITFSDVNQAVGRYASQSKLSPVKTVALTEIGTGINAVNFVFNAATNFPGSNITDQVARELLSVGHIPLSHITGQASDSTNTVYVTGRDIDSGTRSLVFIETGFGLLSSASQYMVDTINSNALAFTAAGTNIFNGLAFTAGNGGYFSGGDLSAAVAATATQLPAGTYLVGYASASDTITKGAKALSYNGVDPWVPVSTSTNTNTGVVTTNLPVGFQNVNNGIANGSYSLWSIEHLYINPVNAPKGTSVANIGALASNVATTLTGYSTTALGNGFTALTDLNVKRANNEGSVIISK